MQNYVHNLLDIAGGKDSLLSILNKTSHLQQGAAWKRKAERDKTVCFEKIHKVLQNARGRHGGRPSIAKTGRFLPLLEGRAPSRPFLLKS